VPHRFCGEEETLVRPVLQKVNVDFVRTNRPKVPRSSQWVKIDINFWDGDRSNLPLQKPDYHHDFASKNSDQFCQEIESLLELLGRAAQILCPVINHRQYCASHS
jgi:hypothetical protein